MNNTLHIIDYAIIIFSLVVTIGVGLKFSKKQTSTSQFFSAGGNVPAWAIGMSIFATLISSITFLAYPGAGFGSNWILLVQGIMVPITVILIIPFIVPLYRSVIGLSAYEYFEKRFGYFARLYSSLGFIFAHFSKMGSVFFILSLALASMTGIDTYTVIIILGIAVILITLFGGMEAVIWLDVIQGFLLIFGGLIALGIIILKMDGGLGAILEIANEHNKINLGPFDWDFVNLTFWVMAINGVFYAIQKYGTDQTIVQRYLAAKSNKEAKKASVMGVLMVVPVWTLFMFIGTALFAFYSDGGHVIPEGLRADAVFPHFIMNELPVGIVGIIISALLAAAISSLDSDLNCLSAVGVDDYYKKLRPNSTDAQRVRVGKILVVLSGIGAMIVASIYVSAGDKGVLGVVFMLYAIFSGGIVGIFLLGVFVPRANKQGLYVGIAASVLFTAFALLSSTPVGVGEDKKMLLDFGSFNYTQHKYMLGVYSHVILFFVAWTTSYFFPKKEIDKSLTYSGWLADKRSGKLVE
jgi:SSS family solute:Na+ symporter